MNWTDYLQDPVVVALLTGVLAVAVMYQRTLSWREYRQIHRLKLRVLPVIDRHTSLFVVSRKHHRLGNEFLETRTGTVREVWEDHLDRGASPHLICSIKRRHTPDGVEQWSQAHAVWLHDDGTQTEIYLFDNGDGTVDVYAHHETGVTDPTGHLTEPQMDGDPRGVVGT